MAKKKCRRCQQIRIVAILVCMIAILLLMMVGKSQAEIYKYTDDNGKKVFVGSLSHVPQKYQAQIQEQFSSDEVSNISSFSEKNKKASTSLKMQLELERLQRDIALMETAVTVKDNQVFVPVKVTYHGKSAQVNMLMDTGASGTVFHRDAIVRLDAMSESAGYARVAGGTVVKLSSIEFDKIQVGPFQAKKIRSFVIDNKSPEDEFDGLLGMDFLMNVKYELDADRQVIIWNPARYKSMQAILKELQSLSE